VLCEEPPSIASSADGVPIGLEGVLRGALAKDRDRRTPDAAAMAAEFRELRDGSSTIRSAAGMRVNRRRRRTVLIGGLAGAVAIVIAAVLVWQWSRPGLAFADQDKILIADVENLTNEEAFDLALRTALETDLRQSPYATLYQRHQVEETLRLMRKSADSLVDEDLGRDLCRFAGVRALVLPRILQVGEAFELQAAIVDPLTGRHVEQIRVGARSREDVLLDAIDELTRKLRSSLGESLASIEKTDFPIADVTTSSWEALHYFAMANRSWGAGEFKEAIGLDELALELDPDFATCRGSLGLLLIQFGGEPERGREELSRALADGDTLPRDEYLMLRAANRHFVDHDLEGALGEYELINELYPRHMAAYNNRGRILFQLGRYQEAADMFEKAAEIDPMGTIPLVNLAFMHVTTLPDPAAAEDACRRLIAIEPEIANYHSMLGWALAVQGRYDEAEAAFERALEIEPEHPYAMPNLGYTLMAAGQPELALLYLRRNLARVREQNVGIAVRAATLEVAAVLAATGDREQTRRFVDDAIAELEAETAGRERVLDDHTYLAQLLAAAGRFEEGEEELATIMAMEADNANSQFEIARACAVLGHRECAIEGTRKAFEMGFEDPYLPMLIPSMHSLLGDPEFMALFPLDGSS
jgi:tetratricopeptide (TPR) repeat protein